MGTKGLILGCCTAVLDRPLFARLSLLQVALQSLRPRYHCIVATGEQFACEFLDDLLDDRVLFAHLPEATTTLSAFTHGLRELHDQGVNLFVCLDHDCVYKRGYLQAIAQAVTAGQFDLEDGLFCLNMVEQQWINLYDDARADIRPHGFQRGLGLPAEEAKQISVGSPSTFVFGRGAAEIVIERFEQGGSAPNGYHDKFWRRALFDAGIRITQVQTPEPVFAYVRHSNNLCWNRQPVGVKKATAARLAAKALLPPWTPVRPQKSGRNHDQPGLDVSVVIPTFNEGEWLARTVDSIQQSRTDLNYEIVVVNDGCTDGSVAAIGGRKNLRVIHTGGEQSGLVIAKNAGAKAARARHLCFIDSHMLAHDYWLDCLRETCDAYPNGALVSGNLPDTELLSGPGEWDQNQYGYIIRNCMLGTGWHHYGRACRTEPYLEPLNPGALMFTRKAHFARLGGFDSTLRKWGAEDIQISLHNYCMGGENVVDPRVVVFHYYKNSTNKKRTFTVTNAQHAFNCLQVAATYFPHDYYLKVREAMASKCGPREIAELESQHHARRRQDMRSEFVRGFDAWIKQFSTELRKFLADAAERQMPSQQLRPVIAPVRDLRPVVQAGAP